MLWGGNTLIIAFIALLIIPAVAFAAADHSKVSVWVMGIYLGCLINMLGSFFIFAKIGGLPRSIEHLFFITDNLRFKFAFAPMSFDNISRMLIGGRVLFIISLLLLAFDVNRRMGKMSKRIYIGFTVILVTINVLLFDPWLTTYFYKLGLINGQLDSNYFVTRFMIIIFIIVSMFVFLDKYRRIKISWIKRNFRATIIMVLNICWVFIIFGVFGPLQISDASGFNYVLASLFYYSPSFSAVYWYIIVVISIAFAVMGSHSAWRYFKIQQEIGKPDIAIEKKLRENDAGVRMFTHGIKNQLLVQRVLIKNTIKAAEKQGVKDIDMLLFELQTVNEGILNRMDELREVFKSHVIYLRPESIKNIINLAVNKLSKKRDNIKIEVKDFKDGQILADKSQLSEAICNIISNAFDAVAAKGEEHDGLISITCYRERSSYIIAIRDNGIGIKQEKFKKIFEPFYTEKNSTYNWGLGLSYVQKVIINHYGMIRIKSQVGVATTFYIFIPVFDQ